MIKSTNTVIYIRAQALGNTSKSQLFFSFVAGRLPEEVSKIIPYIPTKKYKALKKNRDTIAAVATDVMAEKQTVMKKGLEGGKDLMSRLIRANAGEDEKWRMSEEEINAGIG